MESAVLRQTAQLFVFTILVEHLLAQSRKFIVIHHQRKALGSVLPDERIDDAERLTRAGSP